MTTMWNIIQQWKGWVRWKKLREEMNSEKWGRSKMKNLPEYIVKFQKSGTLDVWWLSEQDACAGDVSPSGEYYDKPHSGQRDVWAGLLPSKYLLSPPLHLLLGNLPGQVN